MDSIFSTIRTIIPATDWVAVYVKEDAPFYQVYHLPCIVAGREKYFLPKTRTWEVNEDDTLAFMDVDADGVFSDPTETSNFLAIAHDRDIDDELKAHWSQLGQAYLEKNPKNKEKTNAA